MFKFKKMSDRVEASTNPYRMRDAPIRENADDEPFEFGFQFEIDNIRTMKFDEPVYSRSCIVNDLAWRIMVRKSKKKETLGFFLHCEPVSKRRDSYWTCYACMTLTIVNRKNSSNNLSRETRHLFCSAEYDWGYGSFHTLKELYNSNLVMLNSAKFQVSVAADPPEFSDMNDEHSEVTVDDLLTTNLQTEDDSFETCLSKDLAEMNLFPMNLRAEMSSFKRELQKDFATLNSLLATNLQTEISSFKTDLRKDLAEMMKEIRNDFMAQMKSEAENSDKQLGSGEKKRAVEKKMENVDSTEIRKENEAAQIPEEIKEENRGRKVDTVVEESPKKVKEKKGSKDDDVRGSPVKMREENETQADTVVTEIPETPIEDGAIVFANKGRSVDGVVAEEQENFIDDFEIVSRVEGKNIHSKNSDTSSSFEMIAKNISDDNRTYSVSEKTAESDLVIDIDEEHFANENDDRPVTTADLTNLADSRRNRLLEIFPAPDEDVMKGGKKSIATNQEKKSCETQFDFTNEVVKYLMETYPTLVNEDMVRERLKHCFTDERWIEKSTDIKSDVPDSSYSLEKQHEDIDS